MDVEKGTQDEVQEEETPAQEKEATPEKGTQTEEEQAASDKEKDENLSDDSSQIELEKENAFLREENEKLKRELKAFSAQQQISAWSKEIAEETGVPADALRGSTREELAEHAHVLRELLKPKPVLQGAGTQPSTPAPSPMQDFAKRLLGKAN